tara:strand:+ start:76 stop:864 length:789 start_codon:yes stop_codon:yes gene_type:complete
MNTYTLNELQNKYPNENIPYKKLLKCNKWIDKRKEINKRDKKKCQLCFVDCVDLWDDDILDFVYWKGKIQIFRKNVKKIKNISNNDSYFLEVVDQNKSLNVHHKVYFIDDKKQLVYPWEYNNNDLVTLCRSCHNKTHKSEKIPKKFRENNEYCDEKIEAIDNHILNSVGKYDYDFPSFKYYYPEGVNTNEEKLKHLKSLENYYNKKPNIIMPALAITFYSFVLLAFMVGLNILPPFNNISLILTLFIIFIFTLIYYGIKTKK